MPDRGDSIGIDLRKRNQQIDGTDVVPNSLHSARRIAIAFKIVVGVVSEGGIIGCDDDVTALGEFAGISSVGPFALAVDDLFSERSGGVQSEDSGALFSEFDIFWKIQKSRSPVAVFRNEGDRLPDVKFCFVEVDDLRIEIWKVLAGGQGAGDLFESGYDGGAAFLPIFQTLDWLRLSGFVRIPVKRLMGGARGTRRNASKRCRAEKCTYH